MFISVLFISVFYCCVLDHSMSSYANTLLGNLVFFFNKDLGVQKFNVA